MVIDISKLREEAEARKAAGIVNESNVRIRTTADVMAERAETQRQNLEKLSGGYDYSKGSNDLLFKIIENQARKNDPSVSIDRASQAYLNHKKEVDDYYLGQIKAGKLKMTEEELTKKFNEQQSSFSYFNSLASEAKALGIDVGATVSGSDYNKYLATQLKAETPIDQKAQGILAKAKGMGSMLWHGIVDTSVGVSLLTKDSITGSNSYDKYFYGRDEKSTKGFISKSYDLLFKQYAIVDVMAGAMNLIPGIGTAASIGLFSLKGGIKAITKKSLKKAIAKASSSKRITDATKGQIEKILAIESAEEFTKAVAKQEELITGIFKHPYQLKSAKATTMNVIGDTLDIPFVYSVGEFTDDLVKGGLKYQASPARLAFRVGLPLLAQVSPTGANIITNGVNELSGLVARNLQIGIVKTEREKFIEQNGVDPYETSGELREAWENKINYLTRTSGAVTTFTGYQPEENNWGAKFGIGILEGALNFGGMMGMLGQGKKTLVKQWNNAFGIDDGSKGSQIIQDIVDGKDIKNSFLTDAKIIKSLEESHRKLKLQRDDIVKLLNEEDTRIFLNEMKTLDEAMRTGNNEDSAKTFKRLGDRFEIKEKKKELESGINETTTKIEKLSKFLNGQTNHISNLAKFGHEMSMQLFTREKASMSMGASILEKTALAAAIESIKKSTINIPNRMMEIFDNQASAVKKMNNLFDKGNTISGIVDIRLRKILESNHFTKEQYEKVRDVIGPQLTTKILKTGLAFSQFKNKSLTSIINTVIQESFGVELSKRLSGNLEKKLSTLQPETKNDLISKELDQLVNESSSELFNLHQKLEKEVESGKQFLYKKALQLRAQEEFYSQWLFKKNKQKSANDINNHVTSIFEEVPYEKLYEGVRPEHMGESTKTVKQKIEIKDSTNKRLQKESLEKIEEHRGELRKIKNIREREINREIEREESADNKDYNTPEAARDENDQPYHFDNWSKWNSDTIPYQIFGEIFNTVSNIKNPINFDILLKNKLVSKKYGVGDWSKSIINFAGNKGLSNREQLIVAIRSKDVAKELNTKEKETISKWYLDTEFVPDNVRKWAKETKNAEEFSALLNEKLEYGYFLTPNQIKDTLIKQLGGRNMTTIHKWFKESEPKNILNIEVDQSYVSDKDGDRVTSYEIKRFDNEFVNHVIDKNGKFVPQFSPRSAPEIRLLEEGEVGIMKFLNFKANENSITKKLSTNDPDFYKKVIVSAEEALFKKGFITIADTNDAEKNGVYVIKPKKDISNLKYGSEEHKELVLDYFKKAMGLPDEFKQLTKAQRTFYYINNSKYLHALFSRNVKFPEREFDAAVNFERAKVLGEDKINTHSVFVVMADPKSLADGWAACSRDFGTTYKTSVGNQKKDPTIKIFINAIGGITYGKPGTVIWNESYFKDENVLAAFAKAATDNKLLTLKRHLDQDMNKRLNREELVKYLNESNVIDGVMTETAVKQPFFKDIGSVKGLDSFAGQTKKVAGDVIIAANDNITLTRISVLPKNGNPVSRGRVPNQASYLLMAYGPESYKYSSIVQAHFTKLQDESFSKAVFAVNEILKTGNGDLVQYWKETFGKDLPKDFIQINKSNVKAFYNMLSDELTKSQQGLDVTAMNVVTHPILDYTNNIKEVQKVARSIFKTDVGENFVIVERNPQVEKIRGMNNGRMYLHRNPSDGSQTFVMPYVLFRDEISSLGKTKIDGLVYTTESISNRKKEDYDRDSVVLIVDEAFYGSQKSLDAMNRLADKYWELHEKGNFSGNVESEARAFPFSEEEINTMSDAEIFFQLKDNSTKAKANMAVMLEAKKILSVIMSTMVRENETIRPKFVLTGWDGLKELNNLVCQYVNRAIDGKAGGTVEQFYAAINPLLSENVRFGTKNEKGQSYFIFDPYGLSDLKYCQEKIIKANENYKGTKKNPWTKTFKEMGGKVKVSVKYPHALTIDFGGKQLLNIDQNSKNLSKDRFFPKFKYGGKEYSLGVKGITKVKEQPIITTIRSLFASSAKDFRGSLFDMTDLKIVALDKEKQKAGDRHRPKNGDDRGIDVALRRWGELVLDDGKTESNHPIFALSKSIVNKAHKGELEFPKFGGNMIIGTNAAATKIAQSTYTYDANQFKADPKGSGTQRFVHLIDKQNDAQRKSWSKELTPEEKVAFKKEANDFLEEARSEFRTMSEEDGKSVKKYLLNKYGVDENFKVFLTEEDIRIYQYKISEAVDKINKTKPQDTESIARVAEAIGATDEVFKGKYGKAIRDLNETYQRVSDPKFKLLKAVSKIIEIPGMADRFKRFFEITENCGINKAKSDPDFAEFALIGSDLIKQINTDLEKSKKAVDNTNMDVNTKPLPFENGELRRSVNKSKRKLNNETEDLSQKILTKDIIKIIIEKTTDGAAKNERITKAFAQSAMKTLEKMLSDTQKIAINSSDFDSEMKRIKSSIATDMLKQGKGLSGIDSFKAFFDLINKAFKTFNVGIAIGRAISEPAIQQGLILAERFTKGRYGIRDKTKFSEMIRAEIPDGKMPILGKMSTKYQDIQRKATLLEHNKEVSNKLIVGGAKMVGKIANTSGKLISTKLDKQEQEFYESDYMTTIWQKYNQMKSGGEDGTILFRPNLSFKETLKKNNILSTLRRQSEKKAAEVFFGDYNTHPLFIQNMEDVMPFSNFLFTGIKIMNRYPKSILLAANMLMSMQNQFGEEGFAIDEDGNKIATGKKHGLPLLGWLGFGNIAINTQRLLQISPNEFGGNPYPFVSYLTGINDWRVKKYYQDVAKGEDHAFGWLMADGISPSFHNISNFAHTGDVSELVKGLGYYATGFVMKDRTQSEMITKYFNGDYAELLEYGDAQFAEFAGNEKIFGNKKPTKKAVEILLKAEELGLIGNKQNPYDKTMRILSKANTIHLPDDIRNRDDMALKYGIDLILGKKIYGDEFDESWLENVKTLYDDENYSEFEKVMPGYAEAINHYVSNHDFYKNLFGAMGVAYDQKKKYSEEEKLDANLTLTALRYKFEDEPEHMSHLSNLERKKGMIESGKLSKIMYDAENIPMLTQSYENSLKYKGIYVESYTKGVASVEAARQLKMVYYSLAKTAEDKKSEQKYWKKFNEQKSAQLHGEAMLYDLISTDKESFVSKHGDLKNKNVKDTTANLYFLKRPDVAEKIKNSSSASYAQRLQANKYWIDEIAEKDHKSLGDQINILFKLTDAEKEYYLKTGANPGYMLHYLQQEYEAGKINEQGVRNLKAGNLGNLNL